MRSSESCRVSLLVCAVMVAGPAWAAGQTPPVPKLVPPEKVLSLHRPTAQWDVVTTIVLKIEPTTHEATRTFRWTDPGHGELECDGRVKTTHEIEKSTGTTAISCTYRPSAGYEGADSFMYTVKFGTGAFVEEVNVPIEVRSRGFRWEFRSNGATVTSDAPDPETLKKIPDIIGGTSQDFLFSVNWQTLRPRTPLAETAKRAENTLLRQEELATSDIMASRSANFLIETGVQTEAVSATVVDVGPSATTMESGPSQAGGTSQEAVARRNLVLRGDFNVNASFNADGVGRFVELGGFGKGSFSTVLDSNESFKEAVGRVLQVVPTDRSTYRVDAGVRFAVKQAHEMNTTTLVNPKREIERPTNIENMFLVEFGLRFDTAVSALETKEPGGDSRNRWAVRAEFSPEIHALPGHQLSAIGFEVSRALAGGPPSIKVTYGVNLSATKGIFK
jgi:hypothetical protein